MIGIIGAMDVEVFEIKAMAENKKSVRISGIEYVLGTICGKDVVIAKCDPGKVNAAVCTQTMILKFAVELIINVAQGFSETFGLVVTSAWANTRYISPVDNSKLISASCPDSEKPWQGGPPIITSISERSPNSLLIRSSSIFKRSQQIP